MRFFVALVLAPLTFVAVACSDDDSSGGEGATGGASGTGGRTGGPPPTYDCSEHKWADVPDECWSCICNACKAELDACNTDCTDIFMCAVEKETLVDNLQDIQCEIRATYAECIDTSPRTQAQAEAVSAFDTCLIASPSKTTFRACDAECNTPYPGDVCARYPDPAGM